MCTMEFGKTIGLHFTIIKLELQRVNMCVKLCSGNTRNCRKFFIRVSAVIQQGRFVKKFSGGQTSITCFRGGIAKKSPKTFRISRFFCHFFLLSRGARRTLLKFLDILSRPWHSEYRVWITECENDISNQYGTNFPEGCTTERQKPSENQNPRYFTPQAGCTLGGQGSSTQWGCDVYFPKNSLAEHSVLKLKKNVKWDCTNFFSFQVIFLRNLVRSFSLFLQF